MICLKKMSMGCIIALSLLFSPLVQANDASSQPDLQLSVGDWPPFLSENLPHQGVVAHLIKDIFADAGYNVTLNFLPWSRAYQDTANTRYAATAVWMYQSDREADFLYSDPVLDEQFVFFYRKDELFDWESMADLQGKLIGGGLGYSYGPVFDQALEEGVFELIRVNTVEQNLRMLAAGRTDVFAEEMSVAYHTLQNKAPELADVITHHPEPFLVNQSYLLFPRQSADSEALMAVFNKHLAAFKQDGRYQSYFDRLESGYYQ